jgi:hypothetical protein
VTPLCWHFFELSAARVVESCLNELPLMPHPCSTPLLQLKNVPEGMEREREGGREREGEKERGAISY